MAGDRAKTALVLGATGGIGGETARTLVRRGWTVRALHRDPGRLRAGHDGAGHDPRLSWIAGDAMDPAAVADATAGTSLVVHAVNPPGYRNWGRLVLPMLDNTIAAAERAGARIALPGTVYNFGPDVFPEPDEDAPQNPWSRKGAIRVDMERRLRAAAARGVPSIVLRAGDFFGPRAANNWFSQCMVKPGRPIRAVTSPGRRGVGHQWAYLPDVAETLVRLVERRPMNPVFEIFHMRGHWDADGTRMIAAIRAAVGRQVTAKAFPWRLVAAASPVVPLFREMREMRYLWQVPLRMGNARLVAALGEEPHTPLDDAVRSTLVGLGCLPA